MRYLLLTSLVLMSSVAFGQDYVGDGACIGCHANMPTDGFYEGYYNSGHRWKIFRAAGQEPDLDNWPWTPPPPLPCVDGTPLQWSDVEYVIGNFYWKARFIDRDGFIWTGTADDKTQWNLPKEDDLFEGEFVPYHAGDVDKPFNCGKCHTTGYVPEGNQHGLPGLVGTWAADGVQCEACHGPAGDHVDSFGATPPPGGKACSECHFRDANFRMPWKGGFTRHHQQAEDLSHSPHAAMDCSVCHNPHRSVVYDDGGTITACSDCHAGDDDNNHYALTGGMANLECVDCHMARMGKSARSSNEFMGDVRAHLFRIMTDPIAAVDNTYDADGATFWNQDVDGNSKITLDYACLGCHIKIGHELTLEAAAARATNIHGSSSGGNQPPNVDPGGPYSGVVGQSLTLDASGTTDPEDDPLMYLWDFGDGHFQSAPSSDPTATHAYEEAGVYTAKVAVTDGVNDLVVEETQVTIEDGPPPSEGDNWEIRIPFLEIGFGVEFEDFAGFLMVKTTMDGVTSTGLGMEMDGVIFWMDISGSIYFGNINRTTGSMSGIMFGAAGGGSIWIGEQQ